LRVKQSRRELLLALAVAVLVSGAMLSLHSHDSARAEERQALGEGLAAGLAGLAAQPVANRDRITLGILANRLVQLEQIGGIAVYSIDDEMLAISGDAQRGERITAPITQDSNAIGYVHVRLAPAGATANTYSWSGLGITLLIPLALFALWQIPWPRLRLPASEPVQETEPIVEVAEPIPAQPLAHGLIALNLFNQLTLKPKIREQELAHARAMAEAVADLYGASVEALPGTGMLLRFDGSADPERPFQVICAAYLLASVLAAAESHGQYRLGLHTVTLPADERAPTDLAEVQDAALLSAVARPNTLAVSDALYSSVQHPERMQASPLNNPLLNQLESTDSPAWLVSGLAELQARQLQDQARELGYDSADSTPSESTF
jgi:hypothetical protein